MLCCLKSEQNPAASGAEFLFPVTVAMVITQEELVLACNTACVNYLCCTNDMRANQRIENHVTDPENPWLWD